MMTRKTLLLLVVLTATLAAVSSTIQAAEQDCAEHCTEHIQHGLSAEQIEQYDAPQFEQIPVVQDRLNDRWYLRVNGAITVHDAPNGNVLRTLDEGFNFLTGTSEQNGWIQINPGEWVNAASLSTSNGVISEFTGVFLDGVFPEYPIAWMLVNAYPSLEPGGEPIESRPIRYRYTRLHIYAAVEVDGWLWYQIGPEEWVQQTNVAVVKPTERPETVTTDRWISIDLYEQVLTVYQGETPVFATLTSTGLPRWPTYEGVFNIYFRQQRRNMSWGTVGDDFYFLEEVPWTMFFDEGRAIHGAYWHDGLGYRRSHGCVNLSITDARWLYEWVAEEMGTMTSRDVEPEGPNVYVWSSGSYR